MAEPGNLSETIEASLEILSFTRRSFRYLKRFSKCKDSSVQLMEIQATIGKAMSLQTFSISLTQCYGKRKKTKCHSQDVQFAVRGEGITFDTFFFPFLSFKTVIFPVFSRAQVRKNFQLVYNAQDSEEEKKMF